MNPVSASAYRLFHNGALALADVEATGIRVDVAYLNEQRKALTGKLNGMEKKLWREPAVKTWKKRFGKKTNLASSTQLATVLYKDLRIKPVKATMGGSASVDSDALKGIDLPMVKIILEMRKLTKIRDTYLASLLREHTDGFLHPSFNLHLVQTYRSSSDGPNFQNMPVRDPETGPLVRRAILPLNDNHAIGEVDYSGIEVRVAACLHKDPAMLKYIHDPALDMHRDMAAKCFKLPTAEVSKRIRYHGKNGFVFPEFYGSYFEQVAPALWDAVPRLVTEGGMPLINHLTGAGLGTFPKFKRHIEQVEEWFWKVKFPGYDQWRRDWWKQYQARLWFSTVTGFRCSGPMRRNEVLNYPVQGPAFHCLLWSLIRIHRWLMDENMESRIIGQIHDSIVFSFAPGEQEAVLAKARQVMCEDIRDEWKWIIVPLDIEAEVAPVGEPWSEKRKVVA